MYTTTCQRICDKLLMDAIVACRPPTRTSHNTINTPLDISTALHLCGAVVSWHHLHICPAHKQCDHWRCLMCHTSHTPTDANMKRKSVDKPFLNNYGKLHLNNLNTSYLASTYTVDWKDLIPYICFNDWHVLSTSPRALVSHSICPFYYSDIPNANHFWSHAGLQGT